MRQWKLRALGALACLAAAGCDRPVDVAQLEMRAPAEDAEVVAAADGTFPVEVDTDLFRLAPPGECGTDEACGHVHLLLSTVSEESEHAYTVDALCTLEGKDFNAEGTRTVTARLDLCPRQTGRFVLHLRLHRDDESLVESVVGGHTVTRRITVVAPE